ncbi:uncharacterized protein LOC128503147 [Spea bombifrons]|uniref:uncharacterized protein LOC128503147 n=1 Tax=Spea bombifrons TaxID=233779 RepID=UPI00234A7090|nr:uncharacterized protein LOC128503147 [Spea bombifrons]
MVAGEAEDKVPDMDGVLPQLLSPLPHVVQQGVEVIVNDVQAYREQVMAALMTDSRCRQYITALCNLLRAPDVRLCSSAAYILGTVAEDPDISSLLVELAKSWTDWDLLVRLGDMLQWEDTEVVMNAAGALGTLAESSSGRRWILESPDADFIIENIADLLGSPSEWTASNGALVLARICMCPQGCARLLDHPKSDAILRKLVVSLRVDEAGCGLNAAFTLGRLCDTDVGRKRVLGLQEAEHMVSRLEAMMSEGDAGGSRNACFALTCLATDRAGHQHVLKSASFPRILDTLSRLLRSDEQESCWFAAMSVKVLSSYPEGVVRLRQHPVLEEVLKKAAASQTAGKELLEEVQETLANLQRLPQPSCPRTEILTSGSIQVGWEEHTPNSGLSVTYSLFDGERLLYQGPSSSYLISDCKPGQQYNLRVFMETIGDRSPESPVASVTVDEPLPGCPLNFQVTSRTATKVRLSWSPPAENGATVKSYIVFREETPVETTSELGCIVGGLSPSSNYTFSVCACSPSSRGQKVSLVARTIDKGDHAPGKLTVYVIGRSEIFITWDVPRAPLGRFFNYELCMNGKPVYLGTERSYTARRLVPSTEYTFTVCAITSEGRFESRAVTKRTAKDEYSNLSRNHVTLENNQPVASSPARDPPDHAEKQPKMPDPSKHCPTKSHPIRLLLSRQTSRSGDNKSQAPNSRRNSMLSWSTDSGEGTAGPLLSQVQCASPRDVTTTPTEHRIKHRRGSHCRGEPGTIKENGSEVTQTINARVLPMPAKLSPLGVLDSTSSKLLHSGPPDIKKPKSSLGLRPTPVASVHCLEPGYLLYQRAKTETELVRPTRKERQGQQVHECELETESQRRTLEPLRDPLLKSRHRNLKLRAWNITQSLKNGEEKTHGSWNCPGISAEEEKPHPAPLAKNALLKDGPFSQTAGPFAVRHQPVSQFHAELSRIHNLQKVEKKLRKPFKGQRIEGPLSGHFHKDVLALIGESGVTFRLPLAPSNSLLPQRVIPRQR